MTPHERRQALKCVSSDPCAHDHSCDNHKLLWEVERELAEAEATTHELEASLAACGKALKNMIREWEDIIGNEDINRTPADTLEKARAALTPPIARLVERQRAMERLLTVVKTHLVRRVGRFRAGLDDTRVVIIHGGTEHRVSSPCEICDVLAAVEAAEKGTA